MKEQEVILVGGGGHALSLMEFAGEKIKGYLSRESNAGLEAAWLGTDSELPKYVAEGHCFHIAYVYTGLPVMKKRRQLIDEYKSRGASFHTLVSPAAIVTKGSIVGEGSAIMSGAIVNRAILGSNVIINSGAIIEHDCNIGSNTFIGPGAVVGGFTTIGENCFIGLGARLVNGITIGSDISIAMGAVVAQSLYEPGIYHGFPLRLFKPKD